VASVAKGYSTHLDALLNGAMQDAFRSYLPIHGSVHLSPYFDPFAFAVTMVITCESRAWASMRVGTFTVLFDSVKYCLDLFLSRYFGVRSQGVLDLQQHFYRTQTHRCPFHYNCGLSIWSVETN